MDLDFIPDVFTYSASLPHPLSIHVGSGANSTRLGGEHDLEMCAKTPKTVLSSGGTKHSLPHLPADVFWPTGPGTLSGMCDTEITETCLQDSHGHCHRNHLVQTTTGSAGSQGRQRPVLARRSPHAGILEGLFCGEGASPSCCYTALDCDR